MTITLRTFFGEYSVICAAAFGIAPPMPSPARKRITLKVIGSLVNPAAAVKALNRNTQIEIAQRRPILSASAPSAIAPNIMPNSAELAMKPAVEASTFIAFMIDGSAVPATARS